MSKHNPNNIDANVIDIKPPGRRRRGWLLLIAVALVFFALTRGVGIYIESLWFDSLGYEQVYWYSLQLKFVLFLIFAAATIFILRGAFWLLERAFELSKLGRRVVMINDQVLSISPARFIKPLSCTLVVVRLWVRHNDEQ